MEDLPATVEPGLQRRHNLKMPGSFKSRPSPPPTTSPSAVPPGLAVTPSSPQAIDTVDTSFLETLVGYNARRASLAIVDVFMRRMAPFDLRIVDFSVLSLVSRNPGITSRQLCGTLGVQPPNLVAIIGLLEKRELIERHPHPNDRRATGLHLSPGGEALVAEAEATAASLEDEATARLTPTERRTLMRLLQKIYR